MECLDNKQTFPRELRLLTPVHFSTVFASGHRIKSPLLTIVVNKNKLTFVRIGFALAKKQIKYAHERNRIKRIIREYIRLKQHNLSGLDIVLMVRTPIQSLSNTEIRQLFDSAIHKAMTKPI